MDKNKERERLEFLFNILSGFRDIKVSSSDTDISYADLKNREIFLSDKKEYNKKKSDGFQEMGHVWLSGDLQEYINNWNVNKYGDFKDFNWIINVLEDIRTENLMSIRYPQIKNRLINQHIETLNKLLERIPNIVAKDPRAAVYILAEDRFKIPIEIDPTIKEVSSEIKSILDKSKFKDNNWKHMVFAALKISAEIKKWNDKKFQKLQDMLQQATGEVNLSEEMSKSTLREKTEKEDKFHEIRFSIKNNEKRNGTLGAEQQRFEQLLKDHPELKKDIEKAIKEIEYKKEEKTEEIKNSKKDIEDIQKHIEDLDKKQEDLYKNKYDPAVAQQTKIANELAKQKSELNENYRALPHTYQYDFHDLDGETDEPNPGSELTGADIKEIVKKEKEEGLKKAQVGILGSSDENDHNENNRTRFILPPDEEGENDRRKIIVEQFTTSDKFTSEGRHPIPNLTLALATGYEIASELKRKLKLEAVVLKHKLRGKIDIKAVKNQISKYGMVIDPRIMKVTKDLIEKHSVLVLTDFSGSMGDPGGNHQEFTKVQYAKQALVTLGKTLENLNVNYSLRGFSANAHAISDIILKRFDEPHMDYKLVNKVFYPLMHGDNRDGESIRHVTNLLEIERGKKLLIVISDGLPSASGYEGKSGEEDTKLAVRQAEEKGIHIMGISIDRNANDFVLEAYPNSFVFNDLKDFPLLNN